MAISIAFFFDCNNITGFIFRGIWIKKIKNHTEQGLSDEWWMMSDEWLVILRMARRLNNGMRRLMVIQFLNSSSILCSTSARASWECIVRRLWGCALSTREQRGAKSMHCCSNYRLDWAILCISRIELLFLVINLRDLQILFQSKSVHYAMAIRIEYKSNKNCVEDQLRKKYCQNENQTSNKNTLYIYCIYEYVYILSPTAGCYL